MDRADATAIMQQALSAVEIWFAIAYMLAMFAVTAFRPQQIGSVGLFRLSYIFFAMYLIIPPMVNTIVGIISADRRALGRLGEPDIAVTILLPIFNAFGKVIFALAVLCGLASLRHYQRRDLPPVMDDER